MKNISHTVRIVCAHFGTKTLTVGRNCWKYLQPLQYSNFVSVNIDFPYCQCPPLTVSGTAMTFHIVFIFTCWGEEEKLSGNKQKYCQYIFCLVFPVPSVTKFVVSLLQFSCSEYLPLAHCEEFNFGPRKILGRVLDLNRKEKPTLPLHEI